MATSTGEDAADASTRCGLSTRLLFTQKWDFDMPHLPDSDELLEDALKPQMTAFHNSKLAILASDLRSIYIKDLQDETVDPDENIQLESSDVSATICARDVVLAMSFSGCGEFIAIAEVTGRICLCRMDGKEVLAYSVVEAGSSDRVVSMAFVAVDGMRSSDPQELVVVMASGIMLQLTNLRLTEFNKKLSETASDVDAVDSAIFQTIRVQKAHVGALNEGAQSCMLILRYESSDYVILGNHSDYLSVWELSARDMPGIKKISSHEMSSECAPVDEIGFSDNCSLLVILSGGRLSWWNWLDTTEAFKADLPKVLSFAALNGLVGAPRDHLKSSVLGIVSSPDDEKLELSIKLIEITCDALHHLEYRVFSRNELKTKVGSSLTLFNFACDRNDERHAVAVFRTDEQVSVSLLALDKSIEASDDLCVHTTDVEINDPLAAQDAITIAESLANIPISSLLDPAGLQQWQSQYALCVSSIGHNEEDSQAILSHLLQLARTLRNSNTSLSSSVQLPEIIVRWCGEINDLSYRWTTFQLLRSSSSTGKSSKTLQEKWQTFLTTPIQDILEDSIGRGSMRAVTILWSRHLNDEMLCNIFDLLQNLPASLPVSVYATWIRQEVLPALINYMESFESSSSASETSESRSQLTDLARWLLGRAETAAAEGDLDAAIQLCNLLKHVNSEAGSAGRSFSFYEFKLQSSATWTGLRASDQHKGESAQPVNAIDRLEALSVKLQHIKHLSSVHQFSISLSVFEDESPASIAMSMLDRVSNPALLREELEAHVLPYLKFCKVASDPVLRDYITELAESIETTQSTEETRALTLLDAISNTDVRADAIISLLRSVLPPYSQPIKQYAHDCARKLRTERLEEIQEHVRLMDIQDMLMRYGVRQFDIADAKSASRLLAHILSQITNSEAFSDALYLVDAYSSLHCDRAMVHFAENLLSFPPSMGLENEKREIHTRVMLAINAVSEVKKRKPSDSKLVVIVSLVEEVIEFGIALLEHEAEAAELGHAANKLQHDSGDLHNVEASHSFLLRMLEGLVKAYLKELNTLQEVAIAAQADWVDAFTASSTYLLSDLLLTDLQRIRRIEEDFNILLSVSAIREPERCQLKLKHLMNKEMLFGNKVSSAGACGKVPDSAVAPDKGKGKKRAVSGNVNVAALPSKKQRMSTHDDVEVVKFESAERGPQQNEEKARLLYDLNRFAAAVGIDSKICQSLLAQCAAQNGSIMQAVRLSREIFSRRPRAKIVKDSSEDATGRLTHFNPAEALKKTAMALSFYTATHLKEIYDTPRVYRQRLTPAERECLYAPTYSLELLKYSICVCDSASFDETLILLNNAELVNDVLELTQFDFSSKEPVEGLYPHWFRGDACVLPSYQAMKFATRFAIAEHTGLIRGRDDHAIASKRYVSFLVEQQADLLSLQVLLSMQVLPDDAAAVVHAQIAKLLSNVFLSHELDNFFALGLMLSLEQVDAFHAFRKQISRENVTKDFNRFQQLAFIGADAARAWEQVAFLNQCRELEGNARWWHYLRLLGIECKHKAFQSERRDLNYIRGLVPTLLSRSNYDFYTVLEFTRHYQIDDEFPSLVYVESLLLNENATNHLEYQDKIAGVVEDIHEQHLVELLQKVIPKVPGKDYERLLFIFQLLLDKPSYPQPEDLRRFVEVLHILKAFSSAPSKDETHIDNEKRDEDLTDGHGDYRISFHELIATPRKVLSRKLTKENFNALIGLAEPLQLEPDELQILLLKNMVGTQLLKAKNGARQLGTFSFFTDILSCLCDAESRVTASEWLAENFPLGEEKIKALEFALQAAKSSEAGREDSCSTSFIGHEALARLEAKLLRAKVQLLFHKARSQSTDLVEAIDDKRTSELLSLINEPRTLFLELYRRYALQFYAHGSDALHAVACSVGDLLELPHAQLRLELVREWLVKDATHVCSAELEAEKCEDPFELLGDEKMDQVDGSFVKRILYVASASLQQDGSSGEEMLGFLIAYAKEVKPRAGVTFRAKLRALRVILRLGQLHRDAAEQYTASKYGGTTADMLFKELLNYTRHCAYMVTFEEHRVPYDLSLVMKSNKEALTRNLLRRVSLTQPWVLRCASRLMLDFGVDAADLWEGVLSGMEKLKMVRSLAIVLGPLSRKPFIRSLEIAKRLWEYVLNSPVLTLQEHLNQSDNTQRCQQDTSDEISTKEICFDGIQVSAVRPVLDRMLDLLQRCPFLDEIDVPAFVVRLRDLTDAAGSTISTSLDLYGFAVNCALTIPKPTTRFEALVRIIQSGAYRQVLNVLIDTSCILDSESSDITMEIETGELADNFRLVQEVFAEAAKRHDYEGILDTPFEQGFIEYLAASSNIDYLLSLLLGENRMDAALSAVELYYECHPEANTSQATAEESTETTSGTEEDAVNHRWALLKKYVASSTSTYLEHFSKEQDQRCL